jgi:hypothetical protein
MDYIKKYMCCIHDNNKDIEKVTRDIEASNTIDIQAHAQSQEQAQAQQIEQTIKQIQIVPKQHIEIEMKTIKSPTNSNYATNSNYETNSNYDFNEEFNEVTNQDYNDIPPENYDNVKSPTNELKNNLFVSSLSIKNYFKQTK